MNISNIKHMAKNRLHTTKIGRTLCRLVGEESGQTAMEYVVIATLICAAIAVGIWLFGAQILSMFQVAGEGAVGEHDKSKAHRENVIAPAVDAVNQAGGAADNGFTDSTARDVVPNTGL